MRGAIFVLPATTSGQQGPVAAWVSTAGWAAAARRVLDYAWIATPLGLVDPEDARRDASHPSLSSESVSPWRRRLPEPVKTAVKDLRQWRRARAFRVDPDGPWSGHEVVFVWQRHELFHSAGVDLAAALGVPSVMFVPAALIWESTQWGVRRPGREKWLERYAERPSLVQADLLACGSEAVASEVQRLGVSPDRILVTPTGVDLSLFAPSHARDALRKRLGLDGRFVVGWVGSFRPFHSLDQAVNALVGLEGATLLLVGDGPERSRIEALARGRDVHTVSTGTVDHGELPAYLEAMDVGLVLASADRSFHYSPLKLAEYLASGLAVVAPRVPQLSARLRDGVDSVLVPAGDERALSEALAALRADVERRERIGEAARATAREHWSWDYQVRRVLEALR